MKATIKNAIEIEAAGGAIQSSSWTTGRGNYITKRPIPAFCAEIDASNIDALKGETHRTASRIMKKHPRTKKMIVLVDRRGLNAAKAKQKPVDPVQPVDNDDYPINADASKAAALVTP